MAGVMLASAVVSFYLFKLFFAAMADPFEPSTQVMPTNVLLIMSGLSAFLIGVSSRRTIERLIRRHGLPGVIPSPDPLEGELVNVSLTTPVKTAEKAILKEVFATSIPAHDLKKLFSSKAGTELTFAKGSYSLTLTRPLRDDSQTEEMLLVKLTSGNRSLLSLEKLSGSRGKFEVDEQGRMAKCAYTMTHRGLADKYAKTTLTLSGKARVMKAIILQG
jgi:hypothetical protein